ncbi:MAG: 50S ribosomal protein L29 [Candidatus Paceibacterota bacterium]|jgi:ribosomal protein L29
MKKKDFLTMKNKPIVELDKELHDLRVRVSGLKFDLAAGKVKNIQEVKNAKKGIAQILTVKKERSLKEAKSH